MASTTTFALGLARHFIRDAATSTLHQAMAFDAIDRISGPDAIAWQRMFLRHAQVFALGADAPDADFRDFKNHLLFPADNFWGGALNKSQGWYRNLVTALQKQEWQNAAYCAGVLSHYLADASHPLHTAQSEADNDIYAALDVCTWAGYRGLKKRALEGAMATRQQLPDTTDIDALLKASATAAHAQYAPLLTHFDLARALKNPADGLDSEGQDIMAIVLTRAVALVARVLDAAIAEAAVAAPQGGLTLCALQAFAALPVTTFSNWRHRTAVRRAVAAMRREFDSTGHLNVTLPDEVRAKRDAYAREVLGATATQPASQSARGDNVVVFAPARTASPVRENDSDGDAEIIDLRRQRMMVEQPRPAPRKTQAEAIRVRADVNRQLEEELTVSAGAQTNMPAA